MGNKSRVLVVDDDEDILHLLKYNLEKEGYEVKILGDSKGTVRAAKKFLPDLIILDIMMPEINGIEICRKLRALKIFKNTYIFFLTARSESYYQNAAFNTGGDDYIEKIIGLKALTKKISAVLKGNFIIRKSIGEIKIGELRISRAWSAAYISDKYVPLSKPEFDVLFFLAQNAHRMIKSELLVESIWGSEIYLTDTHVDIYIQNLRTKLGKDIIRQTSDFQYWFNPLSSKIY